MTLPRTVADVLADHVVFEVECIDRMYCNVYVPQLQHAGGLLGYIQRQLGLPIASTAPLGKITDAFSMAMRRFARDQQVPWVDFVKGRRKDDVMHEHLAGFSGEEGVLFIGRAQEKTSLFRTERRRDAHGDSYPWIVRSTGVVNQFSVYAVDCDFGPFFLKFCSYFPYNAKLCINGHEWAKRQAAKAGIGHTALDNGFATCDDPAAVQAICDRFGPEQIDGLLRKWLARLPHPFTAADRQAGYRYDISIRQAEFSLTQVLDRPVSGRVFFEHVIRDNLDAGRPDQVSLIFDRRLRRSGPRATPGRFRTRVITEGVTPSLHIDYKHAVIKQYHKEGRALRTETTINDTRDFQIGKRLTNLPALREIGLSANRRLLGVQRLSHNPIRAAEAFTAVHQPIITDTGHRIAGLRLARPPRARSPPSTAGIPAAPERVPQPRPTRPARRTARPRPDQRRPDELRPATAPRPRTDHPHPAQPPLPAHRDRAAPRHAAQPHPHPATAARPGPPHRPRPTRAEHTAHRRPQLPTSSRPTHPRRRSRRLNTKT